MNCAAFAPERLRFRPLQRDDLPLLLSWLASEHVAAWWETPQDPERKYFGEQRPVSRFIALLDGKPAAMVQSYRWSDFPQDAAQVGARPGELGLDYLIGEAQLTGHGLGPALIDAFIARLMADDDDAIAVRVDVAQDNRRSWRCLEKAGFERRSSAAALSGQQRPHYIYVRDREAEGPSL